MVESKHIKEDDYVIFNTEERKSIIIEYVKFIASLGFKPVKVLAAPDPAGLFSFRAMFAFKKPVANRVMRDHTAFFECRNFTDFSLKRFKSDVLDTTDMSVLEDFKKALKTRVWNVGFTDEEILCAILPKNLTLRISDIYIDGKVVIPPNYLPAVFADLNYMGGYSTSSRIIRREKGAR